MTAFRTPHIRRCSNRRTLVRTATLIPGKTTKTQQRRMKGFEQALSAWVAQTQG